MLGRFSLCVFAAASLFAFGAPALAQEAGPTPVPDHKPDFSSMSFLLGTWNCKTTKIAGKRGNGRTETDVNTMAEDGNYMETDSTSKPFDSARTRTLTGKGWIGYDSTRKSWYSFGIGNFGGFGVSTSPGWSGGKIVWTDTYATDGSPLGVATITKVSDTKTTSIYTVKTSHGTETTGDECTKS
jgi:hypothetical protein